MKTYQSSNNTVPGVTDINLDKAVAEFAFMSSILSNGQFMPPRQSQLSPFIVQLPREYSEQTMYVKDEDRVCIALSVELSQILLPMDFSVVVTKSQFALSVKTMGIACIVKIPCLQEVCEALYSADSHVNNDIDVVADSAATDNDDMSFLAELEEEAAVVKTLAAVSDRTLSFRTFYKAFGSDFALKVGDMYSKEVSVNIVDDALLNEVIQ